MIKPSLKYFAQKFQLGQDEPRFKVNIAKKIIFYQVKLKPPVLKLVFQESLEILTLEPVELYTPLD